MNGYGATAESYRKLAEQGKINEEDAKKEIRVLDFLNECNEDDMCRLTDSTAFNDIIRAYVKAAARRADLDRKARNELLDALESALDELNASAALEEARQ